MNRFAVLFVIFAASLWGVDGIVLRPSLYSLPVPLVVLVETTIVALILSPFFIGRFNTLKNLTRKDWLSFLAVAVFGGAVGTMAITKALFFVGYVNLSVVVLIQKLQPVFAIGLAALLLKEHLPKIFFAWAGLAIIGAYLMVFGFSLPNLETGEQTILAAGYALIATIAFAMSTVFSKRALKNVDYKMGTYLRFLLTAMIMLLVSLFTADLQKIGDINSSQWLIFILIVFSTGGPAIFLYYYGLMRISASVATICELAFPLTAVLLEYLVRGELMNFPQWLGVGILIGSIIRVSRFHLKTAEIKKANS